MYYKQLQQIDIAKAINQIVELALCKGTKDKILTISIDIQLDNLNDKSDRRNVKFIFYCPNNYVFVGAVSDDKFSIDENSKIEFLGYHDSCWRDSVESKIRKTASELSDKYENTKGMSVFTSFGSFGNKIIDGTIDVKSSERTASFFKLKK